jgi:enterochelin esterase-like enzyme
MNGAREANEMKCIQWLLAILWLVAAGAALQAQKYAPPKSEPPDETKLKALTEKIHKLENKVAKLRQDGAHDPDLVDIEVYLKAATWIIQLNEFYDKEAADWTDEILDTGLLRASQAARGETPWLDPKGNSVVRAYRSMIDGSIQPYAVTFPPNFNENKTTRLDVVLHGRDAKLTEVKFLHMHNGERAAPKDQDFVQLDIYGRGNNAYRWAGEADVFEAVDNFLTVEALPWIGRTKWYDSSKRVLRGFSMGGAGAWHLGLHFPDRWCAVGPGAGFTTTHGYAPKVADKLPAYQESCLHIYDAVDYAENAADVPVIAYAGSKDEQLQAAKNIEAKLKPLGIPMTLLIGEGLGHEMSDKYRKDAEELYAKAAASGRSAYPEKVHFVTYTMKYPSCDWVNVLRLDQHYERTTVDAKQEEKGFTVKTTNVAVLGLDLPVGFLHAEATIEIDGQKLQAPTRFGAAAAGQRIFLEKKGGKWSSALAAKVQTDQLRRPQKLNGMQGPIDDAFAHPFLCVIGSTKPWNADAATYSTGCLERFRQEWTKFYRGELPIKRDVDVTPEDIASRNLILFGDPASNSLIAQAIGGLPLEWTKDKISFNGKTYNSAEHVPAFIYPSPLSPGRYIVLNSGHTFHAADFLDTNAMLFPRLGDFAILKLAPTKDDPLEVSVAEAGLFDDLWRVGK